MVRDITNLPDDVESLKKIIAEQNQKFIESHRVIQEKYHSEKIKNRILEEKLTLLELRLFSKKSEKFSSFEETQAVLFNEIEVLADSPPLLPLEREAPAASGSSKPVKKRSIPDDLPRVVKIIEPPDSEKLCGCGTEKIRIGEEVCEKVDYIPARAFVRRTVRPKYACRKCRGTEDEGQPVAIAPVPPSLLGKSILGEGLFGHIIVSKFADGLPFHRQESILRRAGIEVSRKTMAQQAIKVAELLSPLHDLLLAEIRNADLLGVDETRFQVLKEKGRRADQLSFLWHIRVVSRAGPIPIFLYRPQRSAKFLEDLMEGFSGPVITDGYGSYNFLSDRPGIVHAGCNAHARRKFVEADKVSPDNAETRRVIRLYSEIYRVESDWKKEESDQSRLLALRNERTRHLVEELKELLNRLSITVNPASALGKAVSYTLGEWHKLVRFLDDPVIPLDNNAVENGIRPFVIGRKNWLFSDTPGGAHASALFYTLIEGAKAAGLDPSIYMSYLLYHAPYAIGEADWRALMPINLKGKDLSLPE